jgi:hypothetical protein
LRNDDHLVDALDRADERGLVREYSSAEAFVADVLDFCNVPDTPEQRVAYGLDALAPGARHFIAMIPPDDTSRSRDLLQALTSDANATTFVFVVDPAIEVQLVAAHTAD